MRKIYPYLNDEEFIYKVDLQHLQKQYVKIILLDWNENPLQEIQGIATSGSISVNGNSSVRRTCSLTLDIKDISTGKITDTKNLISINKKVFLEIGIENTTDKYPDYPILWFPQGVFVMSSCSVNSSLGQGTILSAQMKDKMCLLNGECGGTIAAAVTLDHYDTLDASTGKIYTTQPTISMIIRELVNHFGQEQLGRIIINDIDEQIKKVMRWTGDNPLYLATKDSSHLFTTSETEAKNFGGTFQEFHYGQDVGFVYTDFTYPGELVANAGDSICSVLDKIKSLLGNYEYYYDINGNFVFQEIKNYLNTTQTKVELDKMNNNSYLIDIAKGKSVYDFNDNKLVISFSHSPQYNRIKNDFIVWGIKENTNGLKLPIRYHLAIDKKPKTGNIYEVFFYLDPDDNLTKAKCPIKYENKSHFPQTGVEGLFYLDGLTGIIYKWDSELLGYVSINHGPYIQCNSENEFPQYQRPDPEADPPIPEIIPNKEAVYLSTNTNKTYVWQLNPDSKHYQQSAVQLEYLKSQYDVAMAGYAANIEIQELLIDTKKDDIQTILDETASLRYKKKQIEKEIGSLTAQKVSLEETISEVTLLLMQQQDIVSQKQDRINELDAEIAVETDPVRKAELEHERDLTIIERDTAQNYADLYQAQLDELNIQLDGIEDNIEANEALLVPIEEELAEPDAQIAAINEEIEDIQEVIAGIQQDINNYTNDYEEAKRQELENQYEYVEYIGVTIVKVQATDWRSELYLQGVIAEPLGLESNYYYPELAAEWPKLYNLQANSYIDEDTGDIIYTGDFYEGILENPWDVDYWLDFIDSTGPISQFSIDNIGRRSIIKNSDDYNCVFESEVPDIVIIGIDDPDKIAKEEWCDDRNQDYCVTDQNIYEALAIGGLHNSCFNEIKNLLWEHTNYNSNINISILPIYHLEPNTRITVTSEQDDIHGDFMMSTFSVPLTINGNMSISATQVQNKL